MSKTADGGYSVASVDNAVDGAGVADGKTAVAWTEDIKKNASEGYNYLISSYGSNEEGVAPTLRTGCRDTTETAICTNSAAHRSGARS